MSGTIGMILIIGIILVFAIGLYTAIGIVIYRDAKAHGMPAGMWTVAAILIPNLIGVIIYLVVRSTKEKNMYCSNCNASVEKDYNICPQCKGVFEEMCKVCNKAIKEGQTTCPYCGSEVKEGASTKTVSKVAKKTNIAKPLIIISITYFIFIFIALFTLIGIGSTTYVNDVSIDEVKVGGFSTGISTISIDTSTKEKIKHTFHSTTETTSRKLKVYADEMPQIDINIQLKSGTIEIQILDENKEVVADKVYEGNIDEAGDPMQIIDTVPLQISENKEYILKFVYRKAKNGRVEITG